MALARSQITLVDILDGEQGPIGPRGASSIGLGMKVGYSAFSSPNDGEVYIHGYNDDGTPADVNGFIYYHGIKITVPKGMVNPNALIDAFLYVNPASPAIPLPCVYESTDGVFKTPAGVAIDSSYMLIGYMKNSGSEVTEYGGLYPYGRSQADVKKEVEANTPGQLGLDSSGSSLSVRSFDVFGVLQPTAGYLFIEGSRITIPSTSYTFTNAHGRGYVVYDEVAGVVRFVKLVATGTLVIFF